MNDKLQIQISEIENGYLVAHPEIQMIGREPKQIMIMKYCADYEEVCSALKKMWHPTIK